LELVYLWVKEYKNIHEQGFNFSSRFNCDYNKKTNELTIKENDNYIPDFFGKNINVTAIVGKNGSGKSSVLEYLSDSPKFVVTFENDEFQVSENIGFINKTKYEYMQKNINLDCIYIPSFDYLFKNFEDFGEFSYNEPHKNNAFYDMFNQEMELYDINFQIIERQLNMFLFSKNSIKDIVFPKNIIFSISINMGNFSNNFQYPENIIKKNIKNTSLINESYFLGIALLSQNLPNFSEKIELYIKSKKNQSIKKIFFDFEYELKDISHIKEYKIIKKYVKLFEKYTDIDEARNLETNRYVESYVYLIPLKKFNKDILYFTQKVNGESGLRNGIAFEWDVKFSSGEEAILNLFALLFEKLQNNTKLQYIYIDEGESFLHPNWQKKYISYLVQFIKDNFPNRKIHLILTSHSPFLLSDIPKQNIIFLDKDEDENCQVLNHNEVLEKKQTFGQNIHTLLSDSFFMEDGLIGEFAKAKINEIKKLYQLTQDEHVQKRLKNQRIKESAQIAFNRRKKRLWQIQKIIGEPFLQRVIKNYLDELELLFSDDKTLIAKELAEIEERKKYLEDLQKRKG